jgi:hypothetical protein
MPKRRRSVPSDVVDEVLYRNDHTCCICKMARKHVQIHHIDGDPSNNLATNLAVVCLDCHSLVTGDGGLGRKYGPGEVRRYKRTWEQIVVYQRSTYRPPTRALQLELIGQIDMVVCQILATSEHARRKEMLELLYNLHLWRGTPQIDRQIVEGFGHLAVMSGLDLPRLGKELAAKTWEMCWHFVGPHQVKMDKSDERFVIRCADVVETLAHFDCMMQKNPSVLAAALDTAENFFDIALWYKRERIAAAVLKVYEEALDACRTGEQIEFPAGIDALRKSEKVLTRKLKKSGLKWRKIERKLRRVAP